METLRQKTLSFLKWHDWTHMCCDSRVHALNLHFFLYLNNTLELSPCWHVLDCPRPTYSSFHCGIHDRMALRFFQGRKYVWCVSLGLWWGFCPNACKMLKMWTSDIFLVRAMQLGGLDELASQGSVGWGTCWKLCAQHVVWVAQILHCVFYSVPLCVLKYQHKKRREY